jgi:xylulose-5-phosphate/fructose-6-phosphate phosphoketolase
VRVVNVCDLMILDQQQDHPHGLSDDAFAALFTNDRPVIVAFHGYPNAVKALLWARPGLGRFTIKGYREEGTTTTPLDMLIRNGTSRYDLALQALGAASRLSLEQTWPLTQRYEGALRDHRAYIEQHGDDPPEVRDWRWA